MDINRLTDKSQEALRQAQTLASRRNHQGVDVEHLFSALLEPADGIVTTLLAQTGVPVAAVKKALDQELDRIPQVTGAGAAAGPDQAYVTQRLSRLFTWAEDEARGLKDDYISVEHLLLAIFEEGGKASHILRAQGVSRETLLEALQKVRGHQRVTSQNPEGTYQALERYGRNLTQLACPRQARSRHRAGRGDPPGGAGAVAPHQEQSRAHRRPRRGQDRHRRRAGAPYRGGRRARGPQAEAHRGAGHGASSLPAPSTAASSRNASRPCSRRCRSLRAR